MRLSYALAAFLLMPLSACATLEPEPCSTEWVEWKSERVLSKFARQNTGLISSFRKLTKEDGELSPIEAMRLMGQTKDIEKMVSSFESTVLPELNAAVTTCGTPEKLMPAFTGFLRKQGVSDGAIKWIEPFVTLMMSTRTTETTPAPVTPK